jgi:hypothetical protein
MKRKRLELTYKYLYMQGSNLAVLESGDTEISSYGVNIPYSDPVCREYRDILKSFHEFADKNPRPSCGPYCKVAFVYGEDDGYTEFMGGAVFEQFGREEWAKGDEERSWRLLSEVYRSPDWQDPLAYASEEGLDLNHAPAYGTYDVICASAPLEVLSSYSYLIFVGHNTMSEALYNKLTDYVSGGGILLMGASHLSVNPERCGKPVYVNGGDLTALFVNLLAVKLWIDIDTAGEQNTVQTRQKRFDRFIVLILVQNDRNTARADDSPRIGGTDPCAFPFDLILRCDADQRLICSL